MNMKNRTHETILPILCGCDNWPFTTRKHNVLEQFSEENIWTYEGGSNRRLEKTT
jgi:hypothetical protein